MNRFHCRRCGSCCRWPGAVKLIEDEADAIAALLGLSVEEFLDKHTRLTPDRRYLSLLEKADGSCEFLSDSPEGALCRIEAAKPRQCREFPERWNFPGWEKICKGSSDE